MNVRFRADNPAWMYSVAAYVFTALVLLGVWSTVATLLRSQWQETMNAEMRQNANTALAMKEHTLRILEAVDHAMLRLESHVAEGRYDSREIIRIANETGMTPHILTQLSYVGADGRFQGSNIDPDGARSNHVNLMDRDHVRVHLLPDETPRFEGMLQNGLFISRTLQGKVSGVWTIQLTRKITSLDGRALGVVVASLNQSYFNNVYQGVQLGPDGGVALAGIDGVIRVRVVDGSSTATGKTLPNSLMRTMLEDANGTTVSPSSDNIRRVIGFSRVGDYPLIVLSGTSLEEAFASWRATRNTVLVLTGLLSLTVIGFVAVVLASFRRMAESHAALTHSEAEAQRANQAKSEFLAAMSHELRTPLTSIRGFAELMELRSGDAVIREQSSLIRQGAEHLNALLTEILDLAKIEAGAMPTHTEPVALRPLVRDLTDLFRISAAAKGLALHLITGPDTPCTLLTDQLKLKQILSNLLSNAIKFTDTGSVTVQVEFDPDSSHVLLHVIDTGPGIAVELQEKIFEKFSQGHARTSYQHGGTGLGLSLSRALAELLGGTLVVSSRPGQGARFTLSLPCTSAATGQPPQGGAQ